MDALSAEAGRLTYQIAHTEHVLRRALDRALAPHGLTLLGWAVLSQIAADPGISGADLTRRIFISQQAVSKLLTGLVAHGLVEHTARPAHARIQDYRVTEAGTEVAAACRNVVAAIEARVRTEIGEAEALKMMRRLEQCRRVLSGE